jgi:hypothetical protein
VAHFYYKYFTRVNPLPGPFPFPLVGNLPQLIWHRGSLKKFFEYNHKNYGDIFEVKLGPRTITLNRKEYIEKILSASTKNPYFKKFPDSVAQAYEELGILGKGIGLNQDYQSWRYNRHFFTQAILSPKFAQEATHWTSELFNELESYWDKLYLKEETTKENKKKLDFSTWFNQFTNDMIFKLLTGERSYTMAAYFNTLSDNEKVERAEAIIDETVK